MKAEEKHNQAIEKADLALIKKFQKDFESALILNKEAFLLEKEAALLAKEEQVGEPSESILLKSAAVLAINCKEYREAERLIAIGLAGEPPFEIAEELRNLLEDVNFNRHLDLKGIVLNPSELQLVIAGNSVGYGMAKSDEVFDRIKTLETLTYRTVERKSNKPYRKRGDVPDTVKMTFEPYLSVPRAASMSFTIRFGGNSNQDAIPGLDFTDEVINDLFDNLELVNNGDFITLRTNIPDDNYYDNFVAFSKELAPDGDDVNLVGLTIVKDKIKKDLALTKPRKEISQVITNKIQKEKELTAEIKNQENEVFQLTGRLSFADDDNCKIKLHSTEGIIHDVIVSDGLSEIVKKYFGEAVIIKVIKEKRANKLLDIDPE